MKYKLQCNFCSETFTHIGNSFPTHCPLCFAYVGLDGKPEVNLPFLSKAVNKTPDTLNRQMESMANDRRYQAAEMTGNPVSDFDSMKHTNMRDSLHEGDTSYVPTRQPATDDLKVQFGDGQGGNIDPAILQGVRTGGNANMGANQVMPSIRSLHQRNAHAIVAKGSIKAKG
jgi:hypothetical protein